MSSLAHVHALFGLLLWIMTVALFRQRVLISVTLEGECAHVCRQLSRLIYLLLYGAFGAELLVRVGVLLWSGGLSGAAKPAFQPAPEDLRDLLAYGVLTLITVRLLAALHHQRLRRAITQRLHWSTRNTTEIGAGQRNPS